MGHDTVFLLVCKTKFLSNYFFPNRFCGIIQKYSLLSDARLHYYNLLHEEGKSFPLQLNKEYVIIRNHLLLQSNK